MRRRGAPQADTGPEPDQQAESEPTGPTGPESAQRQRPEGAWRELTGPTGVTGGPLAGGNTRFVRTLPSRWQQPQILGPLGHDVRPDIPGGLAPDLARTVQPSIGERPELVWAAEPIAAPAPDARGTAAVTTPSAARPSEQFSPSRTVASTPIAPASQAPTTSVPAASIPRVGVDSATSVEPAQAAAAPRPPEQSGTPTAPQSRIPVSALSNQPVGRPVGPVPAAEPDLPTVPSAPIQPADAGGSMRRERSEAGGGQPAAPTAPLTTATQPSVIQASWPRPPQTATIAQNPTSNTGVPPSPRPLVASDAAPAPPTRPQSQEAPEPSGALPPEAPITPTGPLVSQRPLIGASPSLVDGPAPGSIETGGIVQRGRQGGGRRTRIGAPIPEATRPAAPDVAGMQNLPTGQPPGPTATPEIPAAPLAPGAVSSVSGGDEPRAGASARITPPSAGQVEPQPVAPPNAVPAEPRVVPVSGYVSTELTHDAGEMRRPADPGSGAVPGSNQRSQPPGAAPIQQTAPLVSGSPMVAPPSPLPVAATGSSSNPGTTNPYTAGAAASGFAAAPTPPPTGPSPGSQPGLLGQPLSVSAASFAGSRLPQPAMPAPAGPPLAPVSGLDPRPEAGPSPGPGSSANAAAGPGPASDPGTTSGSGADAPDSSGAGPAPPTNAGPDQSILPTPAAGPSQDPASLDSLAADLYDRLRNRLIDELYVGRERAQLLTDLH